MGNGMTKVRLRFERLVLVAGIVAPFSINASPGLAQGVPLPGSNWGDARMQSQPAPSAPVPGMTAPPPQRTRTAAPQGGPAGEPAAAAVNGGRIGTEGNASADSNFKSQYESLPLSPEDARARLVELRNLLEASKPQDVQQSIYAMCEWLTDMAEAHNRLAVVFLKNDATRVQGQTERQAQIKFSALKNEAQLLKADLLIKQRRFPEALGPLVDIVVQEPRTNTGRTAYQRLKELGFSEEVAADANAAAAQAPSNASVTGTTGASATPAAPKTTSPLRSKPQQLLGSSAGTQPKPTKKK